MFLESTLACSHIIETFLVLLKANLLLWRIVSY